MSKKSGILWFRNDLRLHDNEALIQAMKDVDVIYPVYVFDKKTIYGKTPLGFPKIGPLRLKFIWESVCNLRESLRKKGSDLWVYIGHPEEIVHNIVKETKSSWVFCNRERTYEEEKVQDSLEQNLWRIGREMRYSRGKMLLHTSDLPFPVTHTPDTFSQFRKEVEPIIEVRSPLPVPEVIPTGSELDPSQLPSLDEMGVFQNKFGDDFAYPFEGGESKGLARLKYYLWETDRIAEYKKTRNEMLGLDYSSRFSPYLAAGCLSPKIVYHQIQQYERERKGNESTYWLVYELLWRDYFRFIAKKYGNKFFQFTGINGYRREVKGGKEEFLAWTSGKTGIPIVDANMREINQTGFMSNRGRQNTASFLIHDLDVNWLWGAEYFESLLVDYDPCSNYGNWSYIAGVGTDARKDRYFKVLSQSKRYDPDGNYIRYWLPELSGLSGNDIHWPFASDKRDALPEIYKNPVVRPELPG